jgi:oligopeptide/dipeptide ABC transporter ATP-binding protein
VVEQICGAPAHPYTKALLSAVPSMDPLRKSERTVLYGEMPSPAASPQGCAFHPRCPVRIGICEQQEPLLEQDGAGHWAACHLNR